MRSLGKIGTSVQGPWGRGADSEWGSEGRMGEDKRRFQRSPLRGGHRLLGPGGGGGERTDKSLGLEL